MLGFELKYKISVMSISIRIIMYLYRAMMGGLRTLILMRTVGASSVVAG